MNHFTNPNFTDTYNNILNIDHLVCKPDRPNIIGGLGSRVRLHEPHETGTIVEAILAAVYWDQKLANRSYEEAWTDVAKVMRRLEIYPCADESCECHRGELPESLWEQALIERSSKEQSMNKRTQELDQLTQTLGEEVIKVKRQQKVGDWKLKRLNAGNEAKAETIRDQGSELKAKDLQLERLMAQNQAHLARGRERSDESQCLRTQNQELHTKLVAVQQAQLQHDLERRVACEKIADLEQVLAQAAMASSTNPIAITQASTDLGWSVTTYRSAAAKPPSSETPLMVNHQAVQHARSSSPLPFLDADSSSVTDGPSPFTPEPNDALDSSDAAKTSIKPFKVISKPKEVSPRKPSLWISE